MKRFLYLLLLLFLVIDLFIAFRLFGQNLIVSSVYESPDKRVVLRSELLGKKVSLEKPQFLDSELKKIGFWNQNNILLYEQPVIRYVTAKKLVIIFTNKLQNLSIERTSKSDPSTIFSYGQLYDDKSQTLTLYIQAIPEKQKTYTPGTVFSFFTLRSIVESTRIYIKTPPNDPNIRMQHFLKDYFKKENREFISVK